MESVSSHWGFQTDDVASEMVSLCCINNSRTQNWYMLMLAWHSIAIRNNATNKRKYIMKLHAVTTKAFINSENI